MAGFYFGQISKIISKYMDTDTMDIGRRTETVNADGSTTETSPDIPLYKDIPCHIAFNRSDNPDPNSADVQPIIVSITIHCDIDTDLQNGDFITARKQDTNGEVLEIYQGMIGFPTVQQSRKTAQMGMRSL